MFNHRKPDSQLIKLFIISAFLFSFIQAPTVFAWNYKINSYLAEIIPDFEGKSLHVEETIKIILTGKEAAKISLDADKLIFESVSVSGKATAYKYNDTAISISIIGETANQNEIELNFKYKVMPGRGILFYPDEIYTQYYTPSWLACNFDASEKSPITISLQLPKTMNAVANGEFSSRLKVSDSITKLTWVEKNPIPAFTFGFAAGNFDRTEVIKDSTRFVYFTKDLSAEKIRRVFSEMPEILKFYEKVSGISYKNSTYTQVLAEGGAMQEMDGFSVIYKDFADEILADSLEDWLFVHEMSHQWWGVSISCDGWKNFWLNEGMATFITAAFKEQKFGREEYEREMALNKFSYSKIRKSGKDRSLAYRNEISENKAGGRIVYAKGALIFNLLRYELGEDAFWKAIKLYSRKGNGKTVTIDDLRKSMEEASGRDLRAFFDHWVYGSSSPVIEANHYFEKDKLLVQIKCDKSGWNIPLKIAVRDSNHSESKIVYINDTLTVVNFQISNKDVSVRLDEGNNLPVDIIHEKSPEMLLNQMLNEPDVYGRAIAIRELSGMKSTLNKSFISKLRTALKDRIANDKSRLVRSFAEKFILELGK